MADATPNIKKVRFQLPWPTTHPNTAAFCAHTDWRECQMHWQPEPTLESIPDILHQHVHRPKFNFQWRLFTQTCHRAQPPLSKTTRYVKDESPRCPTQIEKIARTDLADNGRRVAPDSPSPCKVGTPTSYSHCD
jgi:hypothetical protein